MEDARPACGGSAAPRRPSRTPPPRGSSGTEPREEAHGQAPVDEARLVVLGLHLVVGRRRRRRVRSAKNSSIACFGDSGVEREPRRVLVVVDDARPRSTRRTARSGSGGLDAEPVDRRLCSVRLCRQVGIRALDRRAALVAGQLLRAGHELASTSCHPSARHAVSAGRGRGCSRRPGSRCSGETGLLALPAERLQRLRVEVVEVEHVGVLRAGRRAARARLAPRTGRRSGSSSRKRSGGEPPANEVESRAMRSSRSLASTSWTPMSGCSFSKAWISVRYARISGGSPKTRKRTVPPAPLSEPPQDAATAATTLAPRRAGDLASAYGRH